MYTSNNSIHIHTVHVSYRHSGEAKKGYNVCREQHWRELAEVDEKLHHRSVVIEDHCLYLQCEPD